MFPVDSEVEQEGGHLRSGRRFRSGKRRRNATKRGNCSTNEIEDYELAPHLHGESCDEEEEYHLISEEEEEVPKPDQYYNITAPHIHL